jgi:uncharacterized protein YodC (DUF2158 family)
MPKQKKLKLGEVVQLNSSGSPRMTVVGYAKDGQVVCCWGESEKLKRGIFPAQALIAIKNTADSKFMQIMKSAAERVYGGTSDV